MGTVHGVYLKYVGLSALSYVGYTFLAADDATSGGRLLGEDAGDARPLSKMLPALVMGYSTVLNGTIAVLFKMEWGMGIIGKNKKTGQIPYWSYALFFPFHIPTYLYTKIHSQLKFSKMTDIKTGEKKKAIVASATEVQQGWWVGGCYADDLQKDWGGIVDLTVEFPEKCRNNTKHYLSAPTWDGVPLAPADLDAAAAFAVEARKDGDVLVHCAHGRGRSTTVMCACLVRAGLFSNWEEAFEKGIKPFRPVCKLNRRMRQNLAAWQAQFVDGKKAT